MASPKIIPFESAAEFFAALRTQGKRLVQCHGTFDLLHPGHIFHLEEARAKGDLLVVTITAEEHVRKGPGRPFFNDPLRAKTLSTLAPVDYVVVVPFPSAVEAIRTVVPHVYCKGKEYEQASGEIADVLREEVKAVEQVGGSVCYLGSVVFSSARLLNRHFDHLELPVREFCSGLASTLSPGAFSDAIASFLDLKVLVVGDTIFDRYSYLKVQGLTSKNRIISGRYLREETQCGGALAVYRHVRQFARDVRFLSLVGPEPWVGALLREHIPAEQDLVVREEAFTTIIKQRFVEPLSKGKELSKLFSVNFLDAEPPRPPVLERVLKQLRAQMAEVDLVMLLDFGHGLMQPLLREAIQDRAPLLALNCQTNSNNHGFNIISRQYQRADAFTLDEQELMLACGHRHVDFEKELNSLRETLKSNYAWLTRGPVQTIGLSGKNPPCLCPPFENDIVDTIGAGDAFFSVAALAAARRLPIELATFIGQLAGAQAVRIVGNSAPISKSALVDTGTALLSF